MKIYIVSGYRYWGNFSPEDLFEKTEKDIQIGGGETAMLQISSELAKMGHDVTLFYDIEYPGDYYGIHFLPTGLFLPLVCQTEFDVLVSWDNTQVLRYADRAKCRVLAFQLNDPQVGVFDWTVDLYMHPSEWHAAMTREICPEITESKQRVNVTNGVDYARYPEAPEKVLKQVIYSSSPDRGLHHLLRIWPEVVSREPDATLHIYYDIDRWLQTDAQLVKQGVQTITSERAAILRKQLKDLPKSVFVHGGVGQWRLAEEQARSCVLAYPCDPVRKTEGFSMTILEGISAGCHVLTTDADALLELWGNAPNVRILPLPVDDKLWINALVDALRAEPALPAQGKRYAWAMQAQLWEKEIKLCLNKQLSTSSEAS